ncbi:MAG: HRDC domain-containing protein [Saprospiraceae bacterium]|nr:HRDC domain-containing protein [Saprospiraceae bacterium]MDZ4706467.1 HRDC domain-containing protein [Saprospiraceae bacterium]
MQIKIFNISIPDGEEMNEEMNVFLRSKRVLSVEQQVVQSATGAYWCFCIRYVEGTTSARQKTDYKETLDGATFLRFSRMREIRKSLSFKEGIPAYAIFTDEELSELAKIEELTLASMKSVKGVGEKKIEKYGMHFISKPE